MYVLFLTEKDSGEKMIMSVDRIKFVLPSFGSDGIFGPSLIHVVRRGHLRSEVWEVCESVKEIYSQLTCDPLWDKAEDFRYWRALRKRFLRKVCRNECTEDEKRHLCATCANFGECATALDSSPHERMIACDFYEQKPENDHAD